MNDDLTRRREQRREALLAKAESDDLTRDEAIELYTPQNGCETQASVFAVHERREQEDLVAALDALGDFERELIAVAYDAGQADFRGDLERQIGSIAETVNAAALREAISHAGRPLGPLHEQDSRPMRDTSRRLRAARLVRSARAIVESNPRLGA